MDVTDIAELLQENYSGYRKTLNALSIDTAHDHFLIRCQAVGWDFDGMAVEMGRGFGSAEPATPDAIFIDHDVFGERINFVEFKAGRLKARSPEDDTSQAYTQPLTCEEKLVQLKLEKKALEGKLIFENEILQGVNLKSCGIPISFILVFDKAKNGLEAIRNSVFGRSSSTFVHFGLDKLKKVGHYDAVLTLDIKEFEALFNGQNA